MIKSQRNKILKKMPNFEFMRDPTTLRTTEKVLAKNGLLCTQFQRETDFEQKFFPFANIREKVKGKIFCGYC